MSVEVGEVDEKIDALTDLLSTKGIITRDELSESLKKEKVKRELEDITIKHDVYEYLKKHKAKNK